MGIASNQSWNAQQYSEHARFVSNLGMPVVAVLAPQPKERILDLGCGDGPLTKQLSDLDCEVVGVDASPEMIVAAKRLGLDARVMNGQALEFNDEFDAVFSNAALHWMTEPEKVITGVWRALKPGGRFVGEFGGKGNVAIIVSALHDALRKRAIDATTINPWYNPSSEEYRAKLEARGFTVKEIDLFPRPTPLPGNIVAWLETFAQPFTAALPPSERSVFFQEAAELCRPKLCDNSGQWHADYVRLRFWATKPQSAA